LDRYAKTFTIRWADCDVNGHVRNTAYSEYGIETRMAFLTEHGFGFARFREMGFGPVLLREEIDYLHEVHLGDAITIDYVRLGGSADGKRFKLRHDVWRADGKQAARMVLVGGWMGWAERKLMAPPDVLRDALARVPSAEVWEELPSRGRAR
jgi:acyl-CoA thioester hydrolase